MQTHSVIEDNVYLITAKTDTTVTDVKSGYVLGIVPAETQARIVAISDKFTTEGECIVHPFR